MADNITFRGNIASGDMNLDTAILVCVPSKERYNEVDICIASDENSTNLRVGDCDSTWLPWDDRKKLGYEIARRWNIIPNIGSAVKSIVKLRREGMTHHDASYAAAYQQACRDCLEVLKRWDVIKEYNL